MDGRKIAFLTLGSRGDVNPFLGIAKELRARGHRTLFIGSAAHRKFCEAEGHEFEEILSMEDHERVTSHPDLWKPIKGVKIVLEVMANKVAWPTRDALARHAKHDRLVLVANNAMIAGLIAAEELGIPVASVFLHPYSHPSVLDPQKETAFWSFVIQTLGVRGRRWLLNKIETHLNRDMEPLNEMRVALGLGRRDDLLSGYRNSPPVMLDLWPEWYGPAPADWPPQAVRTGFVAYDGAGPTLEEWSERLKLKEFLDREPILFGMGSEMRQNFSAQVELFRETCRRLERPGLFVSPGLVGKEREDLGDDFKIVRAAPFTEVFPRCSGILTHGGIGTVARGLAAAKPMVVAPLAHDQFDNGHRVERLGAGLCRRFTGLNPRKLTAAFDEIFGSQEVAASCRAIGERMRKESGALTAADLVEKMMAAHAGGPQPNQFSLKVM